MKYIDTDKLRVEIERRLAAYQKNFDKADNKIARLSTDGRIASLKALLPFIDSLQQEQPNIDMEEEVKEYFKGYWPGMKTPEACNHQMVFTPPAIMRMIEYFYELGLNTRKEE